MHLPRSASLAAELVWLDEIASTNDALRELVLANPALADRTVVVTDNQTSGRGRLGREWVAPPGKTLAFSVLVRSFSTELSAGWLPLIAGSAVRRGLATVLHARDASTPNLGVKWPNDVLSDGKKISGILSEMLPDGSVIVGIGINMSLREEELPTATSTSLALLTDTTPNPDETLSAVLFELFTLLDAATNNELSTIRDTVVTDSATLGTEVRALMPNGDVIQGRAVRLAPDGALVIEQQTSPLTASNNPSELGEVVVAAGDIEHLR